MAHDTIIVEIDEDIALVRLNRPQALNAMNARMWEELADALQEADADPEVRVVILTGSDKAFAAGADVVEMAQLDFHDVARLDYLADASARVARARKPVIAAVAGYCLGGGLELAMMSDIVIAADNARFGQPEINLGIIAGLGGTQRLTRAIGKAKAMDMHLTGRLLSAAEAEAAGLVSRVVPADRLQDEARGVARKIAEKSMLALLFAKEAVNRSFETPLAEGILHERRLFQSLFATEDRKEGMAAFREKREPQFRD